MQYSRSLQLESPSGASGSRRGSMYMVPMVEDSTTRRTPASAAASTTFRVPAIIGSMISSCQRGKKEEKKEF